MATIHPTALVAPGARLADDVEIGPYTIIGEHVEIGAGTTVGAHAVITGHTRIGTHNQIFHFVSLGEAPQDKKYAGEPTRLEIGDHNVIREFCTFNTGTVQDRGVTTIGNHNWIMAYVHIAHDCVVGDRTIFANNASLAGHAEVGDWAVRALAASRLRRTSTSSGLQRRAPGLRLSRSTSGSRAACPIPPCTCTTTRGPRSGSTS